MANNKITTKSYLIKRLRDSGYIVDKVNIEFPESDKRRWMILIDNGHASVFATCNTDGTFSFYDGGHFVSNMKIQTDSVEVIIDYLNDRGIINKHPKYGKMKTLNDK